MENENKKSNKMLLVALVAVALVVVVAVLYFSGVFIKKDENKPSNNNTNSTNQSNTNSNDSELTEEYPKAETTTSADLVVCDGSAKLSIENGKVVLTNTKGVKTTDTSIKGEVISIVNARTTCECGTPNDTAVLTKEGDAYLFAGYLENEIGIGEVTLKFIKVKSDKKITGLAGLKIKSPTTCSDENLYAFTGEKEAHIIDSTYNDAEGVKYFLGKTYQELYPYQDWMVVFDLGGTILEHYSDYRVKMSDSDYLKFEGKELLVKGIYPKTLNEQEETYLLVDKENDLYVITFTEENESVKYTITKDKKTVKDIIVTPSEFDYNITVQYTDGSKEELKEVSNYNFIGKKK